MQFKVSAIVTALMTTLLLSGIAHSAEVSDDINTCEMGERKCQFSLVLRCNIYGTWVHIATCKAPTVCLDGYCVVPPPPPSPTEFVTQD